MPAIQVSFRLPEDLLRQLDERKGDGERTYTLIREMERYYAMLARARATMRRQFSAAECGLLIDASNGTLWEPTSIPHLAAEIEDALGDGLAEKWGVDGPALLAKLRALGLAELFALADAAERWWSGPYSKEDPDYGALLK